MRRRIVDIAAFSIDFLRLERYIIAVLCVVFPSGEDARTGKISVLTMEFVLKQYDTKLISSDLRLEGLGGSACKKSSFKTDRQRKQLRKLIDFRFTRDRNYNLPAKRLKTLEAFLLRRIRKLSAGEKNGQ